MSTPALAADRASVSVRVAADRETAFQVFTEEINQWWRRGLKYRLAPGDRGFLHLDGRVGGALYESFDEPSGARTVQTGTVLVWEPPERLVLEWHSVAFAPGERTRVEVTFAEQSTGTLVTVTHTGWSQIREDHPVRHGAAPRVFIVHLASWWGELASALREHVVSRGG